MGDHFVLCVDRLITASTLESDTEARRPFQYIHPPQNGVVSADSPSQASMGITSLDDGDLEKVTIYGTLKSEDGDGDGDGDASFAMVECHICEDEDVDRNMESPCACSGNLKYAHRKCVQRWCNGKGDTVCEICHQQYKPDYTAPRPARLEDISFDIRASWEISEAHLDLREPRLFAIVAAERHFLETEYGECASANASGASCCRSAALFSWLFCFYDMHFP